ncbi:hypothetical protein [Thermoflexus sp.]|uniref:hypothetical protein n=1 Tax=Thermoflexus sp. TaxID=1969742 RepID=UPI00177A556D|nr:hypothetical protein [Thermoflexus sp.]
MVILDVVRLLVVGASLFKDISRGQLAHADGLSYRAYRLMEVHAFSYLALPLLPLADVDS